MFREPCGSNLHLSKWLQGFEPRLATCNTKALPAIISLQPLPQLSKLQRFLCVFLCWIPTLYCLKLYMYRKLQGPILGTLAFFYLAWGSWDISNSLIVHASGNLSSFSYWYQIILYCFIFPVHIICAGDHLFNCALDWWESVWFSSLDTAGMAWDYQISSEMLNYLSMLSIHRGTFKRGRLVGRVGNCFLLRWHALYDWS